MKKVLLRVLTVAALAARAGAAEPRVIPIPGGDFEAEEHGWKLGDNGMAARSVEAAAGGKACLYVRDGSPELGSDVLAPRVRFSGAAALEIRGRVRPIGGDGLGVYVRVYDADGNLLSGESHLRGLGGDSGAWEDFSVPFYTPMEGEYLELWLHSYSHARVEAFLDDLVFAVVDAQPGRPWEASYKLSADRPETLTPADVVGPDGIVYPDWTRCGVQGGIPQVAATVELEAFGGRADDGLDDAPALAAACRKAAEDGAAVLLGPGTYTLERPVTVRDSRVVIRGAGRDRTRIEFRYAIGKEGIAFYSPEPDSRLGPGASVELHCAPTGLQTMQIDCNDVTLRTWKRSTHSGNTFNVGVGLRDAFRRLPAGPAVLRGIATYADGSVKKTAIPIILDPEVTANPAPPSTRAAILFEGRFPTGPKLPLAEDGKRGDTTLVLADASGLEPGDRVVIDGPATDRWKKLTRNKCLWGNYRRYAATVKAVDGLRVELDQPLRIEFPVIDGSNVSEIAPVEFCGVEDLTIAQTENLWISTVVFRNAWNCWARNVRVEKCGRFPVYGAEAKWCEIRDCVFDDAWFKGGGGTAYAGWEHSYDSLIDGLETFNLRHAPLFQWAASGCVIRNGVFHNSDAQWHSGWTNENLMENCVITSRRGNGGYGFGMWASPPEDTAHGPNGPRNVVYNCDVYSERDGLWMGGMNENWIIAYNRFVVENGRGIFAKTASFDHIVRGNTFVLKDKSSPAVYLATPDCVGVELVGNVVHGGNGRIAGGAAPADRVEGNRVAGADEPEPGRPQPAVPSIYAWQRRQTPRDR